jgi:hypothetical protein
MFAPTKTSYSAVLDIVTPKGERHHSATLSKINVIFGCVRYRHSERGRNIQLAMPNSKGGYAN